MKSNLLKISIIKLHKSITTYVWVVICCGALTYSCGFFCGVYPDSFACLSYVYVGL